MQIIIFSLIIFSLLFVFYFSSERGVNELTLDYYSSLKTDLVKKGYNSSLFIVSGKRIQIHNDILTRFGAAKNSRHLSGDAIDILVLDINDDSEIDYKDVDIVILSLERIIKNKGGIGTYKKENWFWNKQMVHFDCRGYRSRWDR